MRLGVDILSLSKSKATAVGRENEAKINHTIHSENDKRARELETMKAKRRARALRQRRRQTKINQIK